MNCYLSTWFSTYFLRKLMRALSDFITAWRLDLFLLDMATMSVFSNRAGRSTNINERIIVQVWSCFVNLPSSFGIASKQNVSRKNKNNIRFPPRDVIGYNRIFIKKGIFNCRCWMVHKMWTFLTGSVNDLLPVPTRKSKKQLHVLERGKEWGAGWA